MSYIEEHLNPGERLVFRTTLHPLIFAPGGLILLLSLVFRATSDSRDQGVFALQIASLALLVLAFYAVKFFTSEFGVTTTRVVVKTGWLNRRSLEVQLAKVEAVAIDQDLLGRAFDYGTLVVGGTGGTKEKFSFIRAPIVFRKQVQQQIEQLAQGAGPVSVAARTQSPEARRERECPFCAEQILAKATRCRFCGQTVEPVL
jgi:uncharacterized membrane protein YdbT with pleckstrin-like domain